MTGLGNKHSAVQVPPPAPPFAEISPAKLARILAEVPGLVFHPEMEAAAFEPAPLRAALEEGLSDPAIIERLCDQAFAARMLICIENIKIRAHGAKDERLFFLADAARYYIEEFRGPAWDNPLAVGLFCRSLALRNGGTLNAGKLKKAIKRYEAKYRKELERRWQAWESLRQGA
ncbi:MAG: hypothetical protein V3S29_01455 [bacterium]